MINKSLLELSVSELVECAFSLDVVPVFKFVKDAKSNEDESYKDALSPTEETPVGVLNKQIRLYKRFLIVVKTKEGLILNEADSEIKLLKLEESLVFKIQQFEAAVKILNSEPNDEVIATQQAMP